MLNFCFFNPNYAYLPPSILDLKAHDMKCHHVEHVGNMLPFDFYPQVTSATCFFHGSFYVRFMWSQPTSSPQKLAGRDAGTKGTGKCSDIWLHDQCLCEMQSDGVMVAT